MPGPVPTTLDTLSHPALTTTPDRRHRDPGLRGQQGEAFAGRGVPEGEAMPRPRAQSLGPRCLRAKLFHELRTAKKGEDSPKPWGTPEHPKKLPLGAERGHFVLAVNSLSERGFSRLGTSDAELFALPQTGFHAAFEIRLFTACSSLTVS